MNYLVLTPDGVGSTFLQRSLTLYLNVAGIECYNTHELLNGIECEKFCAIKKNFNLDYTQTLEQIQSVLLENRASLVSRIADYHVNNRIRRGIDNANDYDFFYKFCNQYYDKIIYCVRDPFEYALSWAIRNQTKVLNVYSIGDRIKVHSADQKYNVYIEYFKMKLNQYRDYQYWVHDNFLNLIAVNYDDLNFDVDATLEKISGKSSAVEEKFGISLNQYSKFLYHCSLQVQGITKPIGNEFIKSNLKGIIELHQYQQQLVLEKKLVSSMPIKMNTLEEKKQRILNFKSTVDAYNTWAVNSNLFNEISKADIDTKIQKEHTYYDIE